VFFDKDYKSIIDLHSYGHDIEASWLFDRALDVLDNSDMTKKISKITKAIVKNVYEKAYKGHSLYNECENGVDKTNRIWWVQNEAVVGFLNAYERDTERTEYLEAAKDIFDWSMENMVDKREGSEWFWEVDENGEPFSKKPIVEPWKCPYHNGRMCMELMRRLKGK
jgi:mannobiose 2-epimerase